MVHRLPINPIRDACAAQATQGNHQDPLERRAAQSASSAALRQCRVGTAAVRHGTAAALATRHITARAPLQRRKQRGPHNAVRCWGPPQLRARRTRPRQATVAPLQRLTGEDGEARCVLKPAGLLAAPLPAA
jgi:hypothetical protein